MYLDIPEVCLVLLVGASSAGKSSFARRHFAASEVVSSDACRVMVADDENDPEATADALRVLQCIVDKRLSRRRLTVVDAANLTSSARSPLLALARHRRVPVVAVVFDLPAHVHEDRNGCRVDRSLHPKVLAQQLAAVPQAREALSREGIEQVLTLEAPAAVDRVVVRRVKQGSDRAEHAGPFDIIGDIHGCYDELVALLTKLGYQVDNEGAGALHPEGRTAVFVGDLVDRGPDSPMVLHLVMGMATEGSALCVPGNHEIMLARALQGRSGRHDSGLRESLDQFEAYDREFQARVVEFIDGLSSHLVLDQGRLVVAHAGLPEHLHNRHSSRARAFALYGEKGEYNPADGQRTRYAWAQDYQGKAAVVYGHTPVLEPEWVNNTICIDTGCVYGGSLTALRYPERQLLSQPALQAYY